MAAGKMPMVKRFIVLFRAFAQKFAAFVSAPPMARLWAVARADAIPIALGRQ
jgi:hypothetical protein